MTAFMAPDPFLKETCIDARWAALFYMPIRDVNKAQHEALYLANLEAELVPLLPRAGYMVFIDTIDTPNNGAAFALANDTTLNGDQFDGGSKLGK